MRILYDLLSTQPQGDSLYIGGAEYGKAVFKELVDRIDNEVELTVFYSLDLKIDEIVLEIIKSEGILTVNINNENELANHLQDQGYDLFFSASPSYYSNIMVPESCLCVGVVHDVRFMELKYDVTYKYFQAKLNKRNFKRHIFAHSLNYFFLRNIMSKAKYQRYRKAYERVLDSLDLVITVSDHSKYSMLYFLRNAGNKDIRVYYTPQKNIGALPVNGENKFGDYVLLVSVNRYEKNALNAIKALERLYSKNMLEAKCVTVGGLPEKIKNKIKHKEKFIHLGYIPTAELENLYKNAQLFIYPSLSEGFGMPPLEAMKYGTKVVASSATAIPEICGDSVFYFNPYSVDEMATRIYQAVNSENLPNDYFLKTSKKQEEDLKRLVEDIKKGFK